MFIFSIDFDKSSKLRTILVAQRTSKVVEDQAY
jgi:hypothetical protein